MRTGYMSTKKNRSPFGLRLILNLLIQQCKEAKRSDERA